MRRRNEQVLALRLSKCSSNGASKASFRATHRSEHVRVLLVHFVHGSRLACLWFEVTASFGTACTLDREAGREEEGGGAW